MLYPFPLRLFVHRWEAKMQTKYGWLEKVLHCCVCWSQGSFSGLCRGPADFGHTRHAYGTRTVNSLRDG